MNSHEVWVKRIEELVSVLEGSTVGELELREADMEITIRRQPGMVTMSLPTQQLGVGPLAAPMLPAGRVMKPDTSIAIVAPLTGVYYAAPSPSSPPFVVVGDVVQVGQVVALIEAMKVFNEIQSEVSGRVTAIVAANGNVVQKGDVLLRIEPS